MNKAIRLCMLVFTESVLVALACAQPSHAADVKGATVTPSIVSAAPDHDGALLIVYGDGKSETIPKDKRGSYDDTDPVDQTEVFSDIQLSADKQLVGWAPQYMACAQNWPCTPEVVVYQPGHGPKSIEPPFGIVWHWMFARGYAVVIHYGFPHGDEAGEYGLFDLDSGRETAKYSQRKDKGPPPDWVGDLE